LRPLIAAAIALLIGFGRVADAQVIRGRVVERTTTQPVPGVLVSLEALPAPDSGDGRPVANALTDQSGAFALRATAPGEYRVTAKRIGVRRYQSEPFRLGTGETRQIEIPVEPVTYVLPEVSVVSRALCAARPEQAGRVASLWDEAGTALTAVQISLRERLFRGSRYRYTRELELQSLRVLGENRQESHGLFDRSFQSVDPDSLARLGFWFEEGNATNYFAPDADVLLSTAFLRTHCFSVVDGEGTRSGMVGLRFEPARGAHRREIRGTLWLDARTFELRLVDFVFTGLPREAASTGAGGEVRFARLPNGAWAARRWYLRMPSYATYRTFGGTPFSRVERDAERAGVHRIIEEGGDIFAEGIHFFDVPAVITGTVVDSAGQPLSNATVRLGGSPFTTTADALGAFRFDSLPSGAYTLIAEHPGYANLGIPAASHAFELAEGATQSVSLRASATALVVDRLCEGMPRQRNRGTLRLLVRHADTREPLALAPVHLFWTVGADGKPPDGLRTRTDGRGWVTFCNVPAGPRLLFSVLLASLQPGPIQSSCRVGRNEVVVREVLARRPTAAAERYQDTLANLPVCHGVSEHGVARPGAGLHGVGLFRLRLPKWDIRKSVQGRYGLEQKASGRRA
jgi:hypothetical protein